MNKRNTLMTRRAVNVQQRDGDDGARVLSGYGGVYYREDDPGTEYWLWGDAETEGSAVERMMPGCFDDIPDDVMCTFNHDPNQLLSRTTSGSLRVSVDSVGVKYESDIDPDDPDHRRVQAKIARGDVDGSSMWFKITDEVIREKDGITIFEVNKVELKELGPVVGPAYTATSAEARSAHIESRRAEIAQRAETPAETEPETPKKESDGVKAKRKLWILKNL